MAQKDNILQELKELNSKLAGPVVPVPYAVPDGYFDGLIAQVIRRVKAMEAPTAADELSHLSRLLGGMSKEMPYSVPAGYFEELPGQILAVTANDAAGVKEELETISPFLAGLKKENPYAVPQGYFEQLTPAIEPVASRPAAKVISLNRRKWFRYAAAAVIVAMVAVTGVLVFNKKEKSAIILAKVKRDVRKMDETQKDKLIDFIDAGLTGTETAQANNTAKTNEVKTLLQGISAEELKEFEQQTEDLGDVLMNE